MICFAKLANYLIRAKTKTKSFSRIHKGQTINKAGEPKKLKERHTITTPFDHQFPTSFPLVYL